MNRFASRTVLLLLFAGLVSPTAALQASVCSIDTTPAATLLLPYFEVNLAGPPPVGITTLLSINNASTQAVLAKAEIWSDLGVPIFGFMLYLKGLDVQTINLYDVIALGVLPRTSPPAGTFPSCSGVLPPAPLSAATKTLIRQALTGGHVSAYSGLCAGRPSGSIARGYLTVDTMSQCTLRYQGDPGFFGPGGTGDATNQNVLWGDFSYVEQTLARAEGSPLVAIEANATDPETSVPGQYTFYGAFVGWSAADNREPLPSKFAVRYLNGSIGSTPSTSDLIVWRDPKGKVAPFTCPLAVGRPSWYPLDQERIEVGDETGQHRLVRRKAFPVVAQRVKAGGTALPSPYPFGFFYLNLNKSTATAGAVPPEDPDAAQAWVQVVQRAGTTISIGFPAMQYASACSVDHVFP